METTEPKPDGNGAALLKLRRPSIPISLGIEIPIRALSADELVLAHGFMLDVAAIGKKAQDPADDQAAAKTLVEFAGTQRGKEFFANVQRVVRAGSLDPIFETDPLKGAVVTDLPVLDQLTLYHAILDLSGFNRKAGEAVRPS